MNLKLVGFWNSGKTQEQAVERFGNEAKLTFEHFERTYGCSPVPMIDMYPNMKNTLIVDPVRRSHLGLDGCGFDLKRLIKAHNITL